MLHCVTCKSQPFFVNLHEKIVLFNQFPNMMKRTIFVVLLLMLLNLPLFAEARQHSISLAQKGGHTVQIHHCVLTCPQAPTSSPSRHPRETSSRERSENDIFSHFIEFFENNKYKKIQFIHNTNILKISAL